MLTWTWQLGTKWNGNLQPPVKLFGTFTVLDTRNLVVCTCKVLITGDPVELLDNYIILINVNMRRFVWYLPGPGNR